MLLMRFQTEPTPSPRMVHKNTVACCVDNYHILACLQSI